MAEAQEAYKSTRRAHWDTVARIPESQSAWGRCYHRRLTEIYRTLVLPDQRVIELGCGTGDLLAAVKPSRGVGVDFSAGMIRVARENHPELEFLEGDAHDIELSETFDVVILSDLLNDLWDVQTVFARVSALCNADTRVIINGYSRLWEAPLSAARGFGMARPNLYQNWLTVDDVSNLLALENFEVIRHWSEVLCPLDIPFIEPLFNRFLVKLWPFRIAAMTNIVVAAPNATVRSAKPAPVVSVVVPARNEAGHIPEIVRRLPEMGHGTELIFVEGHSRDNTYAAIEQAVADNPHRRCKFFRQTGEGKGDAVRLGFAQAEGDILMILDADMTVPPEDLTRFYEAIVSGKGEFINGVRLVYPMEDRAMRFINLMGNKFFSLVFSWLLGQPIKDTLCGTKVLSRAHYEKIAANRAYFGEIDPFGDFDLLLGAARLNLKILEMPIRYRERQYGDTNIRRWSHGALLLRMAALAAARLKFV
jgi:SAM-dependent methyltransferase